MDKRYQVFISSTYDDLKEERREVIQALLELDCIPAGMELFQAGNEDQWTLIRSVIDDCDYYLVIIGGRYGSTDSNGMSFTEKEYRHALGCGKPVLSFLHKSPDKLPLGQSETDSKKRDQLANFRALAQEKMVNYWDGAADLGGKVSRSIIRLTKTEPAIGWVRGNLLDELGAEEMLRLRKELEALQAQLQRSRSEPPVGTESLAKGRDVVSIDYSFRYWVRIEWREVETEADLSWDEIFGILSPLMIDEADDRRLSAALAEHISVAYVSEVLDDNHIPKGTKVESVSVKDHSYQTIKVQLRALGLIAQSVRKRGVKDTMTYWTLTPYGDTQMLRLRAVPHVEATSVEMTALDD